MILNRSLLLSLIGTVAGSFLIGLTLDLPDIPASTPLLSWALQVLDVLKVIVFLGGLAFTMARLLNMGQIPSTRLPGETSPLLFFLGVLGLWLVGFSTGIGMQLLT